MSRGLLLVLVVWIGFAAGDVIEIAGTDITPVEDDGAGDQEPIDITGKDTATKAPRVIPDDGYLPNWCGSDLGLICPLPSDLGVFTENDYNACLYKCQDLSCLGANYFSTGRECQLSSQRCAPADLVPGHGVYFRRLVEGEDAESCPGGMSPTGLDDDGPANQYCKGVGVECPGGEDITEPTFATTERQCLTRCNSEPRCRTAHYFDKICHLRNKRCEADELEEKSAALDFYRLMKGEVCPPARPLHEIVDVPYTGKFCMMPNRRCNGHSLYRKPQAIYPLEQCLIRCSRIKTCGGVDFFNNKCDPKSYRCEDEELENVFAMVNLMRLQEGEVCPGNRKPPPKSTEWSAKFCKRDKKRCPGEAMEGSPFEVKDYVDCLTKCVKSEGCMAVLLHERKCALLPFRCEDDQYEEHHGTTFTRLRNSEECPPDFVPPECPENSAFNPDAPACVSTCADPESWANCALSTLPGCQCLEGYISKGDDSGECMPINECDCYDHEGISHMIGESWRTLDCLITSECALGDDDWPRIETAETPCGENEVCEAGACVCALGYIRQDFYCVPSVTCGQHSTFSSYVSTTPNLCHHSTREAANSETNPGCACNPGYIRKEEGGECVPLSDCGCKDEGDFIFLAGDTWISSDCAQEKSCDLVPDSFPQISASEFECPEYSSCQSDKGRGLCACDDGYTLEADGTCTKACAEPRVFDSIAKTCQDTCRLPKRSCVCETTAPACVCPEGMILNAENQCVKKESCPCYDSTGEKRMPHEQWMTNDCGAVETCEVRSGDVPEITSVLHQCQDHAVCDTDSGFPQCVCKEGFELGDDGRTCLPVHPPCEETITTLVAEFIENLKTIMHDGCGSCSDTCRNPTGSSLCPLASKICSCQREGHLFDEATSRCLPANECNCYDVKGIPRPPGSWWLSQDCSEKQQCLSRGEDVPKIISTPYTCLECDGMGVCMDLDNRRRRK